MDLTHLEQPHTAGDSHAIRGSRPPRAAAAVRGRHVLADFWGCDTPADEAGWRRLVGDAVGAMGATLLGVQVHTFDTGGVTVVAMLSESHLSVHTWPERGYVAVDVFTCGIAPNPRVGVDVLRRALGPRRESVSFIQRGDPADDADA